MEKLQLIERAKMYLKMFGAGIHPISGIAIPEESVFLDDKTKKCFAFITEILDEYIVLYNKVEQMENQIDEKKIVVLKKQRFCISQKQCENIKLSQKPITMSAFMKSINSVIDADSTEKLSSTRINKWLVSKGLIKQGKIQAIFHKTVYRPSEIALKMGIVEEEVVDKKSGEIKMQIMLDPSAQLFIIENIQEIVETT